MYISITIHVKSSHKANSIGPSGNRIAELHEFQVLFACISGTQHNASAKVSCVNV